METFYINNALQRTRIAQAGCTNFAPPAGGQIIRPRALDSTVVTHFDDPDSVGIVKVSIIPQAAQTETVTLVVAVPVYVKDKMS